MRVGPFVLLVVLAAPLSPVNADFYRRQDVKDQCSGVYGGNVEPGDKALVTNIVQQRCDMYLLGIVDGIEMQRSEDGKKSCIPAGLDGRAVLNPIKAELMKPSKDAYGTSKLVRRVLKTRFGCE
ncbi:Rap1a/Tai family immunity protein [Sphingobium subterraneum]|uniref:Rap1a immunity protein domain-containing protein n=1 Tax=Sphingobium subterraneum TaxID=627688 RepID=A0A841IWY1_9SPHN|nr:Rap1a/Tai family immunity protein [Sphingobium subterraneum]MBB6122790.1 hypothetical protein [Sphingobium subterraneum]